MFAGFAGLCLAVIGGGAAYKISSDNGRAVTSQSVSCLPSPVAAVRARSAAIPRTPGNLQVFFDASGGMAGYVASHPNAIGNLNSLARNFVNSNYYRSGKQGKVQFHRFGEYRFDANAPTPPEIVNDPNAFAKPSPYTEKDTRIADLLRWIVHQRKATSKAAEHPLSIIVTDFMLDDREAVDDAEASVGGALRNMVIKDGLAVGIMAVRVPFDGKIFVDGKTFQASLPARPLVILMIGEPYQVRTFYEYLDTSEARPFSSGTPVSDRDFALFGLEAGSISLFDAGLSGISNGFSLRPPRTRIPGTAGIPAFSFDAAAAKSGAKGGVKIEMRADAGVADFEVIGNEPLSESAIWKIDPSAIEAKSCASGAAWTSVGSLPLRGWSKSGQQLTYTLDAAGMAEAGIEGEGIYMIQLLAGQRGVVDDHPAAAWMREWSTSNADLAQRLGGGAGAERVGIPGLEPLRRMLLTELTIPGREAIERSASQFIVQSE